MTVLRLLSSRSDLSEKKREEDDKGEEVQEGPSEESLPSAALEDLYRVWLV